MSHACLQRGEEGCPVHGWCVGGQSRQSTGELAGQWRYSLQESSYHEYFMLCVDKETLVYVFICLFQHLIILLYVTRKQQITKLLINLFFLSLLIVDLVTYITRFQWDMAKYPIKQSLKNISEIISKVRLSLCLTSVALQAQSFLNKVAEKQQSCPWS